jgi:hypothetical protein
LLLVLIFALYGAAIPLGHQHVTIEAATLLMALLWDFLRSGAEITNVDGPIFRRPARILAYLGYIALVGTTILFLSAQTVGPDGAPVEFLEAEDVVRQGIIWLGVPVLLLRFLFQWINLRRREHGQPTTVARVS